MAHGPLQDDRNPARPWWALACLVGLTLLVRWPFLSMPGFPPDQQHFLVWAQRAANDGVASVYDELDRSGTRRRCNYPPLYVLVCWMLGKTYPLIAGHALDSSVINAVASADPPPSARAAFVWFKLPAVLADAAMAAAVFGILRRRAVGKPTRHAVFGGLAIALNPALLYNSAVFGQVDSLLLLFMLLCIDAASLRSLHTMSLWLALALLTKPQAAVLLPPCAAVLWYGWPATEARARAGRALRCICIVAGLALVAVLPFGRTGWPGIRDAYVQAAGFYPVTHLNGFSAWFLGRPLARPDLQNVSAAYARDDAAWVATLTPRQIGLALFAGVVLLVLWRLRRRSGDDESLRWAASLLAFAFFTLSTQMHERYLLPAVGLGAWALGCNVRTWSPFVVASLVSFVNIAWTWPGPTGAAWSAPLAGLLHVEAVGVLCALAVLMQFIHMLIRGPAKLPA